MQGNCREYRVELMKESARISRAPMPMAVIRYELH